MTPAAELQPLAQETTASRVASTVREAIALGHIAPGQQLGEVELARQLGVSRGPLREGLQRLTQEGILIARRNRGLFVIDMTPERVRDVYTARQAVERGAADEVHARGDARSTGSALLSVVEQMERATQGTDDQQVTDADLAFHELLVERSHSSRLIWMHRTLITETRMCLNALVPTYASNAARVTEHRAIADAFAAGDLVQTDRLLVAHMRDGVDRLLP
ncbi:GntR family transcriptional regulator [Demetria terragena]|uniref:GntR family transcriptional regulator n=1 Tax=Demetria terragena TaxID=63959 RepID=UPI000362C12D|nr:GntR family transcriptional regulator [Demetria terragena]